MQKPPKEEPAASGRVFAGNSHFSNVDLKVIAKQSSFAASVLTIPPTEQGVPIKYTATGSPCSGADAVAGKLRQIFPTI
jgi:hypothetical protein